MNILLSLAIAMIVGLLMTRLIKLINLPNVTAYLIAGLLVGKFVLGQLIDVDYTKFSLITDVALAFIAFSIGVEFKIDDIKHIGGKIISITMFQAFGAVILVDASLLLLSNFAPNIVSPAMAITLGAIATATAPAATLMVVRQYKAKGPVTSALLPVVAFDDAVGLVVYSISIAIAKAISGTEAASVMSMLVMPLLEILASLALGIILGFIITLSTKFFKSRANRLCWCVLVLFFACGLSELIKPYFSLSNLLICMMIGATFSNTCKESGKILDVCDRWTPPLFLLFFVISGANLDLAAIPTVGVVGIIYIVMRALGKYFGAYIGAKNAKADKNIVKYLGFTLIPQAGVAIGLAQLVLKELPSCGEQIHTIILCATLVYELIGPVLTKIALTKAGEIVLPPKKNKLATANSAPTNDGIPTNNVVENIPTTQENNSSVNQNNSSSNSDKS